jgi:hypothetical protein
VQYTYINKFYYQQTVQQIPLIYTHTHTHTTHTHTTHIHTHHTHTHIHTHTHTPHTHHTHTHTHTHTTHTHIHTHTTHTHHTHTYRRILQPASAIPYNNLLESVIYKSYKRGRNLTSSTVNGKIHWKYIIIPSTGGTYNINRQKLYRTQIKIRCIQISKTDKINLEIAECLKSLHHGAVCLMDEISVFYCTA